VPERRFVMQIVNPWIIVHQPNEEKL